MQDAAPTHAAVQPYPSRTAIIAAIAALVIGGAIATGVWWLTDNDVDILPEADTATRVIVSSPVEPGSGTIAKDEARLAAAIGVAPAVAATGEGTATKDEAGSAAAITVNPSTGQATITKGKASEGESVTVNPSTGQATITKGSKASEAESQTGPGANKD
jgi:hypothetical protein